MKQASADNQQLTKWLGGIAIGMAAMYLADPIHGRRRRALAEDKLRSMSHKTGDAVNAAMRDAGNRFKGLEAQAIRLLGQGDKPIDDHVLEARVRSKLGRQVMNSKSVDVAAQQGNVTLSGLIRAEEKQQLLELVKSIPGVRSVRDRLEVHERIGNLPGLQGKNMRFQRSAALLQKDWPPSMRFLGVLGGGALGFYGLTRRSPAGNLMTAAGLALLARGLGINGLARMLGMNVAAPTVTVQKSITINASPEAVFDIWTKYENFPYFMSHVMEVRDLGQQRSHWVVKGPAGANVKWDAVLTECTRPTTMAWRSEPGAMVENSGSVHFEPADGGTRVSVKISYSPPAGILGRGLAILLGSDPEQKLEDDLMRMRSFIERGIPPHDAAKSAYASGQFLH